MNSPVIFTYDLSAAVLDFNNMAMPITGPTGKEMPATFAQFAVAGLNTAYAGENLSYSDKTFRFNLAKRILSNMTAVDLSFIERMLIIELVNNVTQIPVVFQRFVELLEKCDIPAAGQVEPIQPVQVNDNAVTLLPEVAPVVNTDPAQ